MVPIPPAVLLLAAACTELLPDDPLSTMPSPDRWVVQSHDCPGINRTDALMVDGDGSLWIGCGSGAEGEGLYVSDDGGASWAIPETAPPNVLDTFRVLSVHRGYGDLVYVAGEGPAGAMAVALDTTTTPFAANAVLTRGGTVGTSFLAGPFVTTSTGAAFADSFTGSDALYRTDAKVADDAASWTLADDWEDDGSSHQILDLVVHDDAFYGVGSTIAEPPYVFLPSSSGTPYALTPVVLADGLGAFSGEMWGVAASAARVVAVGVDQDNDLGKIFVSGADPYDSTQYAQTDVVIDDRATWARGVCMDSDRVVVVGERQPLGIGGFVWSSTDGGASFVDVTPPGEVDTWSTCAFGPDGLVVAGSGATATLAERYLGMDE